MVDVTGYAWIDGIDLWTAFGVFIEKGSADFLKYAPKKESITHDWMDSDGLDVDLSRYFLQERTVALNCAIVTDTETDFWAKHNSFIATLLQPGTRRLELKAHVDKAYDIYYKECNNYSQVLPLKGTNDNRIAGRFTLVIVEPNPKIDASLIFIVDDDGRYLVT